MAWRMGEDVYTFGKLGSGRLLIDVLKGKCAQNDHPVHGLYIVGELHAWFREQLVKHAIAIEDIVSASIIADIDVEAQTSRKKVSLDSKTVNGPILKPGTKI